MFCQLGVGPKCRQRIKVKIIFEKTTKRAEGEQDFSVKDPVKISAYTLREGRRMTLDPGELI